VASLAEANSSFADGFSIADPQRYGHGIQMGGWYPGDQNVGCGFFARPFYVEANRMDILSYPTGLGPFGGCDIGLAASPSLVPIQGDFQGRITGCSAIDANLSTVGFGFDTDCASGPLTQHPFVSTRAVQTGNIPNSGGPEVIDHVYLGGMAPPVRETILGRD